MDRLSSTVMLCLFNDIPDTLTIAQPQQGLRFGIEDGDNITLRSLTDPVGKPIQGKNFPVIGGFTQQFLRIPINEIGENVVKINSVVQTIQLQQYLNKESISPAEFGIQMVKVPESINFNSLSKNE